MSQQNTHYTLLPNAETFLDDLQLEIKNAKQYFAAQFYTFEADSTGIPIAKALINAKKRGIHVRLMIDHYINLSHNDHYLYLPTTKRDLHHRAVAEWQATNKLLDTLREADIEIKMLNPVGFMAYKMFRRDHKKLVVIDPLQPGSGISYIGGINLSDHNASWNDFMVKMSGDATLLINDELQRSWDEKSKASSYTYSDGELIVDAENKSIIIPRIYQLMQDAKKRIVIETPYLWGNSIKENLCNAARRGVDVKIIVPLHNNHRFFAASEKSLTALQKAGAQVYRFKANGGMTHAKALIVDDTIVFGSHNFNEFLAGKLGEANIITTNSSLASQIETFLTNDIAKSLRQR